MPSKMIEIQRGINDQVTGFKDVTPREPSVDDVLEGHDPFKALRTREESRFTMPLMEALISKPDAANLLRDGIRFIAFQTMRGVPATWNQIARVESSDRPEEQYLRDAAMGVIPIRDSGLPVEFAQSGLEGGVKIANYLRRKGVQVTGDDIRFDRLGKIRQIAFELGRSAVATMEAVVYNDLTTAGNFTRNSTTGDNDKGANTAATTWNALGFETGLVTISTAKDRKSGQYLGYSADTIIAGPLMEFPIKQFLMSNQLSRQATAASAEVRGMGVNNPYEGLLSKIIISPWYGISYAWSLCDSTAFSYVVQMVQDWDIMQEGQSEMSEAWLVNNALRYVIAGYFGTGFVDDRAWYYSSSSTAPTVS